MIFGRMCYEMPAESAQVAQSQMGKCRCIQEKLGGTGMILHVIFQRSS